MTSLSEYTRTSDIIDWVKASCGIAKPNSKMMDEDIRMVMRWVGIHADDTRVDENGKPVLGRHGIELMLALTLLEFPEFYSRYELAQFN